MPEYLRALLALLILGLGFFYVVRGAVSQLIPAETFIRWRNLWLVATVVLFLSHSIWIFTLMLGAILLAYRQREAYVMALYFVLLFVAPPAPIAIPGLGIIDHVWVVDHYRLLGVTLLLPAAVSLVQRANTARLGSSPVDWMVLGYVLVMSMLAFRDGNATSGVRTTFSHCIDIFLPYYVASRSLRSEEGLRQAMTGYVIAAMIVALVGIFEVLRTWKLYSAVLGVLGVNESLFGGYLTRSGLLRPTATVGNSIVLGYVVVVGLGFFLYLKAFLDKARHRWLGVSLLSLGIVASLSRGPWVGAMLLVILFVLIGPRPLRRLGGMALGACIGYVVLSQFPNGQLLVDMLPLVGNAEQGNVEYRANLLTAALPVIERNLLTGSSDFLSAPELQVMMQGEGIIDVVNSYIAVLLHSGLAGLVFFAGAFLTALYELLRGMRIAQRHDPRAAVLGRALVATLAAIMLIIYTVSSLTAVPVVYWSVLGIGAAYAGLFQRSNRQTEVVPA